MWSDISERVRISAKCSYCGIGIWALHLPRSCRSSRCSPWGLSECNAHHRQSTKKTAMMGKKKKNLTRLYSWMNQFSSVAQSCLTLCDPMNRSTLGLPVHHQLPEFTQTQVHRVSDAIQPSHPLSSPSPPAPNPSIRVFSNESTLLMRWPKYWSFPKNVQDWSLEWTGWISLQSKGPSGVFSNTTVQKHQFFCAQLSLWSNSHIHTWPLEKP